MSSLYDVLGVAKDATPDQIKKAYRSKAQASHPDREGGSEAAFKAVKTAYEVLSDPARRAQYDTHGTTTEEVPVEVEASAELAKLFSDLLEQESDRPMYIMRTALKERKDHVNKLLKQAEAARTRLEKLNGKWLRKSDNSYSNMMQDIINGKLAALNSGLSRFKRSQRVLDAVTQLLDDHEFLDERKETPHEQARSAYEYGKAFSDIFGRGAV